MQPRRIEITQKTIIAVLVSLLVVFIIYKLRDLLVLVFISVLLATVLNPFIAMLHNKKVPRTLAILIVYFLFIGLIATTLGLVLPPLVRESANLISRLDVSVLPVYFDTGDLQGSFKSYNDLLGNVGGSLPGVFTAVIGTFSSLLVVFTLLVMTYYILVERYHLHHYLKWLFGKRDAEARAERFVNRVEIELGGWARGQMFLMFIIGLMTYIGLTVLGIPYGFPLSILAGVLAIVPNIGPTVSAIPAIALAYFTISPATAVTVLILFILIQQLENNIIAPKVLSSATNISPLIAIILIIAGLQLGGIAGAVLSLPTYILLRNILKEIGNENNPFHQETLAGKSKSGS